MSFCNKIYDVTHTDMFQYIFNRSDKIFNVNVTNISYKFKI